MHTITVGFIPLCASCGDELGTGSTQSDPNYKRSSPFDRDNPGERKEQRVFVSACPKCFVFKAYMTPDGNCEHDWEDGSDGPDSCRKCGLSFTQYIRDSCPQTPNGQGEPGGTL